MFAPHLSRYEMTDDEAKELQRLLKLYLRHPEHDPSPEKMSVQELPDDLTESTM